MLAKGEMQTPRLPQKRMLQLQGTVLAMCRECDPVITSKGLVSLCPDLCVLTIQCAANA
jgi:hypothetical protein